MTDKEFGRKPKFGPVSKKGSPKPPPKNRKHVGWISLRETQPTWLKSIDADGNLPWRRVLSTPPRG